MMGLGANIRSHRKARGWQLWRLSEEPGVDVGTLSAIEKRDSKRSQFAVQIAAAFGLTAEQLTSDNVIEGESRRVDVKTLPDVLYVKTPPPPGPITELVRIAGNVSEEGMKMILSYAYHVETTHPAEAKQTQESIE